MSEGGVDDYGRCTMQRCRGATVDGGRCFLHLEWGDSVDSHQRAAYHRATECARTGAPIDLRGIDTSDVYWLNRAETPQDVLGAVLHALSDAQNGKGGTHCSALLLDDATLSGISLSSGKTTPFRIGGPLTADNATLEDLDIRGIAVEGRLSIRGATLRRCRLRSLSVDGELDATECNLREVEIADSNLPASSSFKSAVVDGRFRLLRVSTENAGSKGNFALVGVRIRGPVLIEHCRFGHHPLTLGLSSFEANVSLVGNSAWGDVLITDCVFRSDVELSDWRLQKGLEIRASQFDRGLDLFRTSVLKEVRLQESRFGGLVRCDHLTAHRGLTVDGSSFSDPITFAQAQIRGEAFRCRSALFSRRLALETGARVVDAAGASFLGGLDLRATGEVIDLTGTTFGAESLIVGAGNETTRLLSLQGANVRHLAIDAVSLQETELAASRNLDGLIVGDGVGFQSPPARRTRRRVIADEIGWRVGRCRRGVTWVSNGPKPRSLPLAAENIGTALPALKPSQIASLYRALRSGQEERGDTPGAGDFYYGEMEMRRHDHSSSRAERWIVSLYWLLSGYGLRASRSIVALIALWGLATAGLELVGFSENSAGFWDASAYAVRASISFAQPGDAPEALSVEGQWISVALRILGPALIALAVLAIRGRVRR